MSGVDLSGVAVLGVAVFRTAVRWLAVVGLVLGAGGPPAVASAAESGGATAVPSWHFTRTATSDTLITVDVVDRDVVWAVGGGFQGSAGSVVRTVDGGRSWQDLTPPGGEADAFRDIEAFDERNALLLALSDDRRGVPARIYRTTDGGSTWQLVFRSANPDAFFDCMAFFDRRRGLLVGDAVGTRIPVLATVDGGRTWRPTPADGMPVTVPGSGALATGTCLVAEGRRHAWFGTVGVSDGTTHNPQVFRTSDSGRTWRVTDTPIPGDTANIASLAFRDRRHGLAVGGNFAPDEGIDLGVAARTSDSGASWSLGGAPAGFRNSVTWVPGSQDTAVGSRNTAVAVGPGGSDVSTDGGRSWRRFDRTLLMGVNCSPRGGCWAVGEDGVAARLVFRRP